MHRVTLTATACSLAVAAVLAGTNVGAQQTNVSERTFMTFSHSVELPGVTLEPGTYEFRLADTPSRNVVQVFAKDNNNAPIGQWTYVQARRPRVSDETVVMFRETAENTTPAIQYWYFPGEAVGKEFVYPRKQASQIADRTGQRVLSEEGPVEPSADARAEADRRARADAASRFSGLTPEARRALRTAPANAWPSAPAGSTTGFRGTLGIGAADAEAELASAAREEGQVAAAQPAPEPSPQPSPSAEAETSDQPAASAEAEVARAEPSQPAPAADDSVAAAEPPAADRPVGTAGQAEGQVARADELPRTASPLPLAGLIGLLSLAGAAGLRALRR